MIPLSIKEMILEGVICYLTHFYNRTNNGMPYCIQTFKSRNQYKYLPLLLEIGNTKCIISEILTAYQ